LKAGFRRGRLLIVSPDSLGTACPLSGRNSTYRPVQILEASSDDPPRAQHCWYNIRGPSFGIRPSLEDFGMK
jgi:hypothetical protein